MSVEEAHPLPEMVGHWCVALDTDLGLVIGEGILTYVEAYDDSTTIPLYAGDTFTHVDKGHYIYWEEDLPTKVDRLENVVLGFGDRPID